MSGTGLADVRTVVMPISVRFDDADHWYRWSMSVAQRGWWELMPEGDQPAVRAAAAAALEQTRDGDGRTGFDQDVRLTLGRRS